VIGVYTDAVVPGRERSKRAIAFLAPLVLLGCRAVIGFEDGFALKAPSDSGTSVDAEAAERSDAAGYDTSRYDASVPDALDASADGHIVFVPPPVNLALRGDASATSTYSESYGAENLNDGSLYYGWFAASYACDGLPDGGGPFRCTNLNVSITFDVPVTIGRVKLFGPGGVSNSGFAVLTARIELLDAKGGRLALTPVTTSRGADTNGNGDQAFTPPVPNVATIRVDVDTSEAGGPGIGEIEAYAQ
jgi:hypothetical protein